MRVLDLFAGQLGWSKAFLARGWEAVAIDLVEPAEIPAGCSFFQHDVLTLSAAEILNFDGRGKVDFICASSPCEEFSVWGMKHFHPNPKHPETGIKLFEHTRAICEGSGVRYVMENVKPAQKFIGQADARCGSFYLWGSGVPPILPQGIRKGATQMRRDGQFRRHGGVDELMYLEKGLRARTLATIPPELANCVAEYAERILEARSGVGSQGPHRKI